MTLHTKYRPGEFADIIGQNAIRASLENALKEKTSQTFLFHGPSGTGKTSIARIAAKFAGTAPKDIMEIDAATFTGIDDMRTVTAGLMYKPFGKDSKKSIIIDECHALSAAAWKSLLKSLEEPPPWVYWFLCTTELGRVPDNIRNRCTRFELKPVHSDKIFDLLTEVSEKEGFKLGEDIIELCAKEAQGSPRQALVNLGICSEVETRKQATSLLKTAMDSPQVTDLAKALLNREPWSRIQPILEGIKDQNPESIRHVVRAWMTSVILTAKSDKVAGSAMEVLDSFSEPMHIGDGISPVVLACGRVILG